MVVKQKTEALELQSERLSPGELPAALKFTEEGPLPWEGAGFLPASIRPGRDLGCSRGNHRDAEQKAQEA